MSAGAGLLDEGMYQVVASCDCHSLDHIARLTVFKHDPSMPHECYLTVRMQRPGGFWRRLTRGFRFVFRPAGFYGDYEEIILDVATGRKLRDALTAFVEAAPTKEAT